MSFKSLIHLRLIRYLLQSEHNSFGFGIKGWIVGDGLRGGGEEGVNESVM